MSLPGAATVPWHYDAAPLRAGLGALLARRRFDRALVFAGAEEVWPGLGATPAVVDLIDCNALEFWRTAWTTRGLRRRLYWLGQAAISVRHARRCFRAFTDVVCVGARDAAWLRAIGGGSVHVIPNGVTLPSSSPAPAAGPVLSFTGSLDFHPNIDAAVFAARGVFPHVRAAMPEARLLIAGRHPVDAVLALAAADGVEVLADVTDMTEVLGRTRVGLAPMRAGSGIKNKVLEAWACARPVVMSRVAANGLALPPGHEALVLDGAPALARAALALLRDPVRANALGAAARAHVAASFSWERQTAAMDALLRAGFTERQHRR